MNSKFAILDFGSQVSQLIARRLREWGLYSELFAYDTPSQKIKDFAPRGIILSGGAHSVYDPEAPSRDLMDLNKIAPLFGICYGMQLIAQQFGGRVSACEDREYGMTEVSWQDYFSPRLATHIVHGKQKVWMSHGDIVTALPPGFRLLASSASDHPAAIAGDTAWAVQFHPEVKHTEHGDAVLKSFVFDRCQAEADWTAPHIIESLCERIRQQVGEEKVLLGLSGGVDSSVVAALLTKALKPEQVHCVFVDTGLLRKNEFTQVMKMYQDYGLQVHGVDASRDFYQALAGIEEPEQKRKCIGKLFIDVFDRSVKELGISCKFLAQGTLYPDVIESVNLRGASVTIKSHHNVGGLPEKMQMQLVEPLRELFKDEVRAIGRELGLPEEILGRHPFPGPGLAVRILGEITADKVRCLQEADAIFIEALKNEGIYNEIWQAFVALLPVKSVGVQGDHRSYANACVLRAVTSSDGMTADWYDFSPQFLRRVSNQITNKVRGINRVVYDVTSKPPGTIEWE